MRALLPLPVTTSTSPAPGKGTSRRRRPSASEIRSPEPYNSPITAASRAQIQGSPVSPARPSAPAPMLAQEAETLAHVARIGLQRLWRQSSLAAQMREPARHLKRENLVGAV